MYLACPGTSGRAGWPKRHGQAGGWCGEFSQVIQDPVGSGLSATREQGPREALFKAGTLEGAQDPAGRSGREKPLPQAEPTEPLFSEEAAKGKETGWKNCS